MISTNYNPTDKNSVPVVYNAAKLLAGYFLEKIINRIAAQSNFQ